MFSILAVILGIAAVIGIHEASHMIVSKLFGVKVLKFSLGFGPVLISKKVGDTQYQLALLPLGGYVSMAGEDPESDVENGFFSLPWYKRSLIALAGPVANLILGFIMILGLLMFFKGWPLLRGIEQSYKLSSMVTTESLKAVGGMVAHTVPASQLSGWARRLPSPCARCRPPRSAIFWRCRDGATAAVRSRQSPAPPGTPPRERRPRCRFSLARSRSAASVRRA